MKIFIWILLLTVSFGLNAQDDSDYVMFSTLYLEPDGDEIGELRTGLKEHIEKFHPSDSPFEAEVFMVVSGPNFGKYVWLEGPQTFTDLDQDLGEGHGQSFAENVRAHCNGLGTGEFWKLRGKSRVASTSHPIVRVRYLVVNEKDNQGYRISGLLNQLRETIMAMEGDFNWGIYDNQFRQGDLGRHIAIVSDFPNWAALDMDNNFEEAFEKIHGKGSMESFVKGMADVFSNVHDEFWIRQDL